MCLTLQKKKKDNRIFFKILKIKNKKKKFWITPLDFSMFFILNSINYKNIRISSFNYSNIYNIKVKSNIYIYLFLLKNIIKSNIMIIDMSIYKNNHINYYLSDIINNTRFNIFYKINKQNNLYSISNLYHASSWVERELAEFNKIRFINLKDSRRLLTDYTNNYNSSYKDNNFNIINQNLYKRVLHWLFLFSFLFIFIFISLIIYNKSLLQLILISEVLIILIAIISLLISSLFNIYYLMGFSILILIFGGLELSLNLLLITIKCYICLKNFIVNVII